MFSGLLRRFASYRTDRRVEPRGSPVEGRISLEGRNYPLKDWSRRGFSAAGVGALLYPGDKIALSVELHLEGEPLAFDCRAVVVWVDRERKEVAGVFTDLDRRVQEQIMRSLFRRDAEQRQLGQPFHA